MATGEYTNLHCIILFCLFTSPHMHWSVTFFQSKATFSNQHFCYGCLFSSIIHYIAWKMSNARIAQTQHDIIFENQVH